MNKKLVELIQKELIGTNYSEASQTAVLKQLIGEEAKCYNDVIADGTDEDETEDVYVRRASFSTNVGIIVHVYYGDVTNEICFVDVCEAAI